MDGNVSIGVTLDTSSVISTVSSLEARLNTFGNGIADALSSPVVSLSLATAVNNKISEMTAAVNSGSVRVRQAMTTLANTTIQAFTSAAWSGSGSSAVGSVANGIISSGNAVTSAFRRISDNAISTIRSSSWRAVGESISDGIASGIISSGGEVVRAIEQVSRSAERAVKSYYKISSPSALMRDEVGVMISRGIAEGITGGSSYVSSAMEKVYPTNKLKGGSTSSSTVTQNIYLRESDSSPYLTAKQIRKESEAVLRQS